MTKISILLPVYNDQDFIKRSIDSILNNSFKDYELIIINDGSNDSTLEILKTINDPRIKLFSKENSGLVDSLNYGLTKCNYDIVMRMDGDDEIKEDKIKTQLNYFKKGNSILLGTGAEIIDNNSRVKKLIDVPEDNINILNNMKNLKTSIIHPSIMFYKDAIIKSGGYDSKFDVAEDFELYFRISKYGNLGNINLPLLKLRKNDDNISKTKSKTQTLNTLIARELYTRNGDIKFVDKKNYFETRERIEKSLIFSFLCSLNSKINDHSKESINNLLMRLIRKIVITLLKYR